MVVRAQQTNRDSLSAADKAEIVESALRLTFGSPRLEFGMPKNLSSENIEFVDATQISRLGFVLLDARQMRKLKGSQTVDYVVFRKIAYEDGIVLVALSHVTERHPCFGRNVSEQGSFTYEFHKDSGEWIGRLLHRPVFQPLVTGTLFTKP